MTVFLLQGRPAGIPKQSKRSELRGEKRPGKDRALTGVFRLTLKIQCESDSTLTIFLFFKGISRLTGVGVYRGWGTYRGCGVYRGWPLTGVGVLTGVGGITGAGLLPGLGCLPGLSIYRGS